MCWIIIPDTNWVFLGRSGYLVDSPLDISKIRQSWKLKWTSLDLSEYFGYNRAAHIWGDNSSSIGITRTTCMIGSSIVLTRGLSSSMSTLCSQPWLWYVLSHWFPVLDCLYFPISHRNLFSTYRCCMLSCRHQQRLYYHWCHMCVYQWPLYDLIRECLLSPLIYTCHNTGFQIYSTDYFSSIITLQSMSMCKLWFNKQWFRAKETETHFSTQRQPEARAVFTPCFVFSFSTDQRKPDPSSYRSTKHSTLLLFHRNLPSHCC